MTKHTQPTIHTDARFQKCADGEGFRCDTGRVKYIPEQTGVREHEGGSMECCVVYREAGLRKVADLHGADTRTPLAQSAGKAELQHSTVTLTLFPLEHS